MNDKIKVMAGHPGLIGDLAINLPFLNFLKNNQAYSITMPIYKKYSDAAPLFLNNKSIDRILILDSYDNYPNQKDKDIIDSLNFTVVLNPMATHRGPGEFWQTMHQCAAVAYDYIENNSLTNDLCQIQLTKWFNIEDHKNVISFCPFAGYMHNPNNDKRLTLDRAEKIVQFIRKLGFYVHHFGLPDEPTVNGAFKFNKSYFESIRYMLGCKFLLHTDSGCGWYASGYQFPQLGLYSDGYYSKQFVKNIQPINPNSKYLSEKNVNDIPLEVIFNEIELMIKNT